MRWGTLRHIHRGWAAFVLAWICIAPAAEPAAIEVAPTLDRSFGVCLHSAPSPQEIQLLQQASLRRVRMDFKWELIEKKIGQYDFSAEDQLVASLAAGKLNAIFILDYSNPIYGPDGKPPFTARGREAFARWAAAAMHHFAGRQILWEVWNEPNGKWFWPNPDPHDYSLLVAAVGRAARREAPGERIIGPAIYGIDTNYLQSCCKDGCLDYFSAVTIHPYRSGGPESVAGDYHRLHQIIDPYASSARIPLLEGEWGYQVRGATAERDRAKLLVRMFLINAACRIPLTVWYDWLDDDEAMGIVRKSTVSGQTRYTPEAGYLAAKLLSDTLGPYRLEWRLDVSDPASSFALEFRNGDQHRYVAWTSSDKSKQVQLPLPNGSYRIIDSLAQRPTTVETAKDRKLAVDLTDTPVYIVPVEKPATQRRRSRAGV